MDAAQRYGWQNLTFGTDDERSRERLRGLILFVANRCQNDPRFDTAKLAKILFRADFSSFARYGEPITGVVYKKLQQEPAPAALEMAKSEMEKEGEIAVKEEHDPSLRDRIVPLRKASPDLFEARDIEVVDEVIRSLAGYDAPESSEVPHGRAWKAAKDGETIPYEAALLSDRGLTERDIERARELIAEHGWDV